MQVFADANLVDYIHLPGGLEMCGNNVRIGKFVLTSAFVQIIIIIIIIIIAMIV